MVEFGQDSSVSTARHDVKRVRPKRDWRLRMITGFYAFLVLSAFLYAFRLILGGTVPMESLAALLIVAGLVGLYVCFFSIVPTENEK